MSPVGERSPADAPQTPTRSGVGRAHAKVILLGEHVVVHGKPAIALPVPELPVTAVARPHRDTASAEPAAQSENTRSISELAVLTACEFLGVAPTGIDVTIDSLIPEGRGLGSSAAIAGAVIRAVADLFGRTLSDGDEYRLIQRSESVTHGRASGVDARTSVSPGGPLWFLLGESRPLPVGSAAASAVLVVADTGKVGSTREAVEKAGLRLEALGPAGTALLDRAGALTEAAAHDLAAGEPAALGQRMNEMHSILAELGVSSPELDALVSAARDAGALGAKLSGGGLGGCMIALAADRRAAAHLQAALAAAGAPWTTEVSLA